MSVSDLSASTQNYLKAVWSLSEWSESPVTTKLISEKTGLKLSSVSDGVRKLAEQGLLEHTPYGSVTLSDHGRAYAVTMVRRHRLIESFLVTVLGYSWDQVHDEAEVLEHAVSDFMIDQIDRVLNYPARDPHGDPIPAADGTLLLLDATPLSLTDAGKGVVVERISDEDPALLQFFDSQGIRVGSRLEVLEGPPFSESIQVLYEGRAEPVVLGNRAMSALFVSALHG
ncbi:MAG: metal-dependent transcriptional regulator [Scrofimicrobium sp.]